MTLAGIPDEAHEYAVGPRSALAWLIDRYQVTTDRASGIVNDPNDWAEETGGPHLRRHEERIGSRAILALTLVSESWCSRSL